MNRILLGLATLAILPACNKETGGQCPNTPDRASYQLYFKGYEAADVDTIVVVRYPHDGSFSSPLSLDSVFSPNATESGGIMFQDTNVRAGNNPGSGFLSCDDDFDYEVILPAVSKTYRIWGITYGHDTATTYYDPPCAKKNFGLARTTGAQVNGPFETQYLDGGMALYLKQ